MNSSIDAADACFARGVREAFKTADDTGKAIGCRHKLKLISAAEFGEERGCSRAKGAVP